MAPEITFYQVLRDVIPPLRADAAALGTLPVDAFRYCEAIREASANGWYCFPPMDIGLRRSGDEEVFITDVSPGEDESEDWFPLGDGLYQHDEWLDTPTEMQRDLNPLVANLPVSGLVQIWTGWLVKTAPGHSLLVRPLVNLPRCSGFSCFEGLIRTDSYAPCPLFINIQILRNPGAVWIPKTRPLFQVQLVRRTETQEAEVKTVTEMTTAEWEGYRKTIRAAGHQGGTYGVDTRRKAKKEMTNAN